MRLNAKEAVYPASVACQAIVKQAFSYNDSLCNRD
jgi:hypothetical protein